MHLIKIHHSFLTPKELRRIRENSSSDVLLGKLIKSRFRKDELEWLQNKFSL